MSATAEDVSAQTQQPAVPPVVEAPATEPVVPAGVQQTKPEGETVAKPTEGEQQTPLSIRTGVQNGFGGFVSDVRLPLLVTAGCGRDISLLERVAVDQLSVESVLKELLCYSTRSADGVFCQPFTDEVLPKPFGHRLGDFPQW